MSNRLWNERQVAVRAALKGIRQKAGFTQAQLADSLAKPQSYISKYENGERRLDYLEVLEVCDACGTTIAKFHRAYEKTLRTPS
jgi:transcriptional regulator with XRE-family HTH domain